MAETYTVTTSNTFQVIDAQVFKETIEAALEDCDVYIEPNNMVGFGVYDDISVVCGPSGTERGIDELLQPMMLDDAVCILSEIYHEGLNFVGAARGVITKTTLEWTIIMASNSNYVGNAATEPPTKEISTPSGRRILA